MKTTTQLKRIVIALAGAGLVSLPHHVFANPTGGQVVAGRATISQETASRLGIRQSTDKAVIDWNKFSIGANEQVQFYQPSASAVALNRVVGPDPSQILGRLTANGQVFLVNPNGIYFGKTAQIDVAGLVASTHNIRTEDFLADNYRFNVPGKPGAAVINEGQIKLADTGVAAFVAPSVANRGVIAAKLGKVALGAANGFTLDFTGDQLLSFLISDELASTAFDVDGRQLTSFVENSGRIEAQGGYVLLTAKAAENAIHSVINQTGVIEATTVGSSKGEILLLGGAHGEVSVAGRLDASAPNGGDGGFVETSGEQLTIDQSTVVTSAARQGNTGTWRIDPLDILVATGGSGTYSSGTSLAFGSSPGGLTIIAPSLLNAATSNIILEATRDIEFRNAVNVVQSGVGLTAKAGRDIHVNAEIKTNNGEINLYAGWDQASNSAAVNDGVVDINGVKVDSGTAARNIVGRGPSYSGLVGYWDFNGDAKDGSGNGNNGTASASVLFTTDGSKQIAKFGGVGSPGSIFVPNSSSLQFTSDMTLTYWVRADGTQGMDGWGSTSGSGWVNAVVAKSHDRAGFVTFLYETPNSAGDAFGNNTFGSPSATISATRSKSSSPSSEWVQVAITTSATEAKLYVNGVLVKTEPGTYNFAVSNTQNLYFGKFSDYWYPLNGALDEVRLYNRTLTPTQIGDVFAGRGAGLISGTVPDLPPPEPTRLIASASYAGFSSSQYDPFAPFGSKNKPKKSDSNPDGDKNYGPVFSDFELIDNMKGIKFGTTESIKISLSTTLHIYDIQARENIDIYSVPDFDIGSTNLKDYLLTRQEAKILAGIFNENLESINRIADGEGGSFQIGSEYFLKARDTKIPQMSIPEILSNSAEAVYEGAKSGLAVAELTFLSPAKASLTGIKQAAKLAKAAKENAQNYYEGVAAIADLVDVALELYEAHKNPSLTSLSAVTTKLFGQLDNPALKRISGISEIIQASVDMVNASKTQTYLDTHSSLLDATDSANLRYLADSQISGSLLSILNGAESLLDSFGLSSAAYAISQLANGGQLANSYYKSGSISIESAFERVQIANAEITDNLKSAANSTLRGIDELANSVAKTNRGQMSLGGI